MAPTSYLLQMNFRSGSKVTFLRLLGDSWVHIIKIFSVSRCKRLCTLACCHSSVKMAHNFVNAAMPAQPYICHWAHQSEESWPSGGNSENLMNQLNNSKLSSRWNVNHEKFRNSLHVVLIQPYSLRNEKYSPHYLSFKLQRISKSSIETMTVGWVFHASTIILSFEATSK